VSIAYTFSPLFMIASNQFAIWIEEDSGAFVRTLFATNFVAKRAGWKIRPQTVPTWIKAANVPNLPQKEIDAVSGPTPGSGSYHVTWDLRDAKGHLVPPGTYAYFVEGNIYWQNRVLWSGKITIGSQPQVSQAEPVYTPPGAKDLGDLISRVVAKYIPAR
jgi:hypothetical protein